MNSLVLQRAHRLAGSLAELKARVRAALATELAGAVGAAVRDVLVGALIGRITTAPTRTLNPSQTSRAGAWWEDGFEERGRWGEPDDPWAEHDADEDRDRARPRRVSETADVGPVPALAVVAVGVNAGRWWLARKGSVPTALGFGALAAVLGLAGGPIARAALAVLAAATDLLTAEVALARPDPS